MFKLKNIAFSANRGRFESILLMCKGDITAIASRKGGGFKSTKDIAEIIAQIVENSLGVVTMMMSRQSKA